MMALEDLFKEGLLKRIPASKDRASKSLSIAHEFIGSSKKNLEMYLFTVAIMTACSAAFHAARAVLFLDGIGERSHFAVYAYLKENHSGIGIDEIEAFNQYRNLRHTAAYGLDAKFFEEDARNALKWAESFLKKIHNYLKL